MASSVLAVRAGVGSWTSVQYILTRGLDIGTATSTLVVSNRHSSSPLAIRESFSTYNPRRSTSPGRIRESES